METEQFSAVDRSMHLVDSLVSAVATVAIVVTRRQCTLRRHPVLVPTTVIFDSNDSNESKRMCRYRYGTGPEFLNLASNDYVLWWEVRCGRYIGMAMLRLMDGIKEDSHVLSQELLIIEAGL